MSTEQEQIDKLTQTLKSEPVAASTGLTIQDHSLRNHLIVFQKNEDGSTHQFLLGITHIGALGTNGYHHDSLLECRLAGMHLTSCDDDGYCNFCGHQEPN
jgi:hypothetical protein